MNIEKIRKNAKKYIGKEIEYFKEIDSTNTYAKKIVAEDVNGKVIIAESQLAGRGTKGRRWYSGKNKNIAMTIILKPKCEINKLDGLTLEIAEKIKKGIEEIYDCKLEIKLPNDLVINGKKICGILTEMSSQNGKINYIIIGIGINVNEEIFSEETKDIATSLKKELAIECNREDIIIKILNNLEEIEL